MLISNLFVLPIYSILYRYGGVWSDLDTITAKSFAPLLNSYSAGASFLLEPDKSMASGVLLFAARHNPFLHYLLNELSASYDPFDWGNCGPALLQRALVSYCGVVDIFDMLKMRPSQQQRIRAYTSSNCSNFTLFPTHMFYPFSYRDGELAAMFVKNASLDLSRLSRSYSFHFYGSLSATLRVRPNDRSVYDYLAWSHCALTYDYVVNVLGQFE